MSNPEVRGLRKATRRKEVNSKISDRLSRLEARVTELGGARNSSSLYSIDADEALVVLYAGMTDRG